MDLFVQQRAGGGGLVGRRFGGLVKNARASRCTSSRTMISPVQVCTPANVGRSIFARCVACALGAAWP